MVHVVGVEASIVVNGPITPSPGAEARRRCRATGAGLALRWRLARCRREAGGEWATAPKHALSETKARADTTGAVNVSLGVGVGQGGDGKAPLPSGTSD